MPQARVIALLAVAIIGPSILAAQAPAAHYVDVPTLAPRVADVATVDGIVKAYYDVITGPAGMARQWSRDRSLYIPDIRFVAAGVAEGRPYAHVMTHQDFVDLSDSSMVRDGFYEQEVRRVTQSYGNIVQVFSTYEWRRSPASPRGGRGINALQLYWDGARWWIASAIWFDEDPAHPIPREYLP